MSKSFSGDKIAILVANGFTEQDLTHTQRALQAKGANTRIIGMDQGVVNSWTGEAWGHHFAADCALNTALAADFDMLIIPGGRRSVEKLKLTAHTRRFLGGFIDAGKPVALFNDALELLIFSERAEGRVVAGPQDYSKAVKEAGATYCEDSCVVDGNLITGYDADVNQYIDAVIKHLADKPDMKEAA
ncbi:MAG: DJ-1/PfpI family protein [Micavibrio sp.]|nr:DJ-1/PfpI family protein [Micavibrio sp.]|tara:strand:+ start:1171 stop:1731 length:561 start_codon:yes stop_codon:yes gene_type:complete